MRTAPLLLALLALAACNGGKSDAAERGGKDQKPGEQKQNAANKKKEKRLVRVAALEPRKVEERLPCTSHVEAFQEVEVLAQATAQLLEVRVKEGQRVEKDDVLFRLDDRDAQFNLEVAQAAELDANDQVGEAELALLEAKDNVTQMDLELKQALRDLERIQKSARQELSSASALETAQLAYDKAKSALDIANTAVKRAELGKKKAETAVAKAKLDVKLKSRALEDYTIKAPISGVIPELMVKGGEWLTAQKLLCKVVDNDNLILALRRPQMELGKLRAGQRVELRVDAFGDRVFLGAIDLVAPIVDPETGTFRARVRINSEEGELKPGMFCRAWIVTGTSHEALMIPKQAILFEGMTPFAFVVRDGKAERIAIDRGIELKDSLEAKNTAKEPSAKAFVVGDQIIVVGKDSLTTGGVEVEVSKG